MRGCCGNRLANMAWLFPLRVLLLSIQTERDQRLAGGSSQDDSWLACVGEKFSANRDAAVSASCNYDDRAGGTPIEGGMVAESNKPTLE